MLAEGRAVVENKANHSLTTPRVELVLASRRNLGEFLLACLGEGIFRHLGLQIVPEVGQEAHPVVQLDKQTLSVNWRPLAGQPLRGDARLVLGSFHNVLALNSLHLVLIAQS